MKRVSLLLVVALFGCGSEPEHGPASSPTDQLRMTKDEIQNAIERVYFTNVADDVATPVVVPAEPVPAAIAAIVSQVETASPDQVEEFVATLSDNVQAVFALEAAARIANSEQNWQHKARLAMLALHLYAPAVAQDMCRLRPNPSQRTWFIEECSTWHGDLSALAQLVADSDDRPLRTAVALAVGSIPVANVTDSEQHTWEPVLSNWFTAESDALTHSAAGWALWKWELEVPELRVSARPEHRNWHVNSLGMTMLVIPDGSFVRLFPAKTMLDPGPGQSLISTRTTLAQTVTLTHPFLLADREVTLEQFLQFVRDPDNSDAGTLSDPESNSRYNDRYTSSDEHAVHHVSWASAAMFCNWLSQKEGLTPFYEGEIGHSWKSSFNLQADGYRMPTEAEWEYACRAGTVTTFSHGDDESLLDRYQSQHSELPGTKLPNGWGLFSLHGNLAEWVHDPEGPFPGETTLIDPAGRPYGKGGTQRYGTDGRDATAYRHIYWNRPQAGVGFRVARTIFGSE